MLRAVLLGVLSIAVVGCNKQQDAPAAQAGAPAGTVLDVTGAVTVGGKPLAKGATVAGDDVVETGADGHVQIRLAHNNATWDLGPNKHEKVSDSPAWTLAKVDTPAKPVDQDTSSAGRPAERSAADTAASADKKEAERADEAAPAPPAAAAAPGNAPSVSAPPPPPAVQPAPEPPRSAPMPPAKTARAAAASVDAVVAGGGATIGAKAKLDIPVEAYQKCVPGGMTLKLTLKGTAHGTTYTVTNGVKLSPEVKACLAKVTAGVHVPAGQHSDLEVSK
jgi:cytochrome c1